MNSMMTIAGAAMGAAARIYCDELDGIMERHFPPSNHGPYVADGCVVRSNVDGWTHEASSEMQAREIAEVMNRTAVKA